MITKSKIQTQKFAAKLAGRIINSKTYYLRPKIIALQGDLGAGKTAFVQGFMKALGVKHRITSPTFLIIRKYKLSDKRQAAGNMFHHAFHLDLYRIRKPRELLALGFKKIISDPRNIVLIEWPEVIKKLLPKNTIWIHLKHGKKYNERIIIVH